MIEKTLRISLTLCIGYVTIGLLCSPTSRKFKWPARFIAIIGILCLFLGGGAFVGVNTAIFMYVLKFRLHQFVVAMLK